MPTGTTRQVAGPGFAGGLRGLVLSGIPLHFGVSESLTEGDPATPSLLIQHPNNFWRFRWPVLSGTRTIQALAKQLHQVTSSLTGATVTLTRPKIIVRANAAINVNSDTSATMAGTSDDWTTVGPITVTPDATGVLWVELWNVAIEWPGVPVYWDHIIAT